MRTISKHFRRPENKRDIADKATRHDTSRPDHLRFESGSNPAFFSCPVNIKSFSFNLRSVNKFPETGVQTPLFFVYSTHPKAEVLSIQ
jgi:hypothetical protein